MNILNSLISILYNIQSKSYPLIKVRIMQLCLVRELIISRFYPTNLKEPVDFLRKVNKILTFIPQFS
jgi:hypothetical protein